MSRNSILFHKCVVFMVIGFHLGKVIIVEDFVWVILRNNSRKYLLYSKFVYNKCLKYVGCIFDYKHILFFL